MKFLEVIKDSLIEDYRPYDAVNYSLLKEVIQGNYAAIRDGIPRRTSTYMDFGSYIDKVITEDKEPDIFIYKHTELSGHSKALVDYLIENKFLDIPVSERLIVADELGLWKTTKNPEKRLALVDTEDINTILAREIARKEGKDVISEEDLNLAKYLLNVLYTHDYSKSIVSPPLKITSFNQLALKFEIDGVTCKVLLDFLQVDHKNKTLQPIDLKTGTKANFLENYFKYYYWLQGALYYLSIVYLKETYKELADYAVLPFKFLYLSRNRSNTPLIYTMSIESIKDFTSGYYDYRTQFKKGIIPLLREYKFHKEHNIYDVSLEEHMSNGELLLPEPY